MKSFIIVSYYTLKTAYEDHAKKFVKSLNEFGIDHHVEAIESRGCWYNNITFKPTFVKSMLKKFPDENIIWVDCDAEFFAYPILFESLDCNIAVHNFDRSYHRRKGVVGFEILSGTIFFKNNQQVYDLVCKWEKECERHPYTWDQKSLAKVLENDFYNLPEEYCMIYDTMAHVKNPVITHYQASREVRNNKGILKMKR